MIYACPACGAKFQSDAAGLVECPTCKASVRVEPPEPAGCAFDRTEKGGWIAAFIETIKLSLVDPIAFFGQVGRGAGWQRPLAFAVIINLVVFGSAAAYQAGFQALAISADITSDLRNALFPLAALSLPLTAGVALVLLVVAVPVFTVAMVFLQAAVCHLCLALLGAAGRDYWATFRTACYAGGPQIFQVVPILGGAVGPVWQLVLLVIGLKVVHRTSYGRSALAVFLPTILCCGIVMLVLMAMLGGIFGAAIAHAN